MVNINRAVGAVFRYSNDLKHIHGLNSYPKGSAELLFTLRYYTVSVCE